MRWTTLILTVALVLGSSLTAWSKSVTLDPAVRLAIHEAEKLEDALRADGVTSRAEAKDLRTLRRSREGLENGLKSHAEGRLVSAARQLRKALRKLRVVFRRNGPARGDPGHAGAEATDLTFEKVGEFVASSLPGLRVRIDALPDSAGKKALSKRLTTFGRAVDDIINRRHGLDEDPGLRRVYIMTYYSGLGGLRNRLSRLEKRAAAQASSPTGGIPGNLPRGSYAVAISANGSSAVEQGVIRNTGGAQLRNALRKLVQALMKGHQQQGCTTTPTSTPFNGTRFTVGARIRCLDGDGGTETTVLNFVITKID